MNHNPKIISYIHVPRGFKMAYKSRFLTFIYNPLAENEEIPDIRCILGSGNKLHWKTSNMI